MDSRRPMGDTCPIFVSVFWTCKAERDIFLHFNLTTNSACESWLTSASATRPVDEKPSVVHAMLLKRPSSSRVV